MTIKHEGAEWCVYSADGSRSFGCYPTKAEAVARLAQVEGHAKSEGGGPVYVQATDDGAWLTVDRATGKSIARFDAPQAALNSLLRAEPYASAVSAETFTGAAWRWLDASAEEAEPQPDGSQVTAVRIRSMIDQRNAAGEPCMIDGGGAAGGGAASNPHQSADDSATRANGWAHAAAEWREPGGRVHLALYAELHPDIAPDVESGRLAKGSILFGVSKTDPDSARLFTHALTNMPIVPGLIPSSAFRSLPNDGSTLYARAQTTRTKIMSKPAKKSETTTETKPAFARGAAADKLAELRAMLGIPADASDDDARSATYDAMYALCNGATLEKILEGGGAVALGPKANETPEAHAARMAALKATPPPVVTEKAAPVAGTFSAEALPILAGILGVDASEAAVLDALKVNAEKLKGAMAAAGGAPADGLPTDGSAPARAVTIGLESKVATLSKRADEAAAETASLRTELARRDLRDAVAARFATAKLVLSDAQRDELVDMALRAPEQDRDKLIDLSLRAANVPPSGRAITDGPAAQQVAGGTAPADPDAAYTLALKAVQDEHKDWPRAKCHAEAYKRSRDAFVAAEKSSN